MSADTHERACAVDQNRLRDNLDAIEQRILDACLRAGRPRSEVTLVAVTKNAPDEAVRLLHELAQTHLGENRPQELWRKAALLPPSVHWHLIGHLQRNKIERTLPLVKLIHSVDSVRLLAALDVEAARQNRDVPVLLEVNASAEASKHGFAPEEVPALVDPITRLRRIRVVGLMTMAALEADPERCRPTFVGLRELRDRLARALPPPHDILHLSMGMSNDFEVAIEAG